MIKIFLIALLILFFQASNLFAETSNSDQVYIDRLEERELCYRGLPIRIVAPEYIDGHKLMAGAFYKESENDYFFSHLQYSDDIEGQAGFFFCSDKESLKYIGVSLHYGYDQCKGYRFSYQRKDMSGISDKGHKLVVRYLPNPLFNDGDSEQDCGE
jgi:hypothetical protein